jgi:Origin of replication binding protein
MNQNRKKTKTFSVYTCTNTINPCTLHRMSPYNPSTQSLLVTAGMGVGKSIAEAAWLKSSAEEYGFENTIIVKMSFRMSFTVQEVRRLHEQTGLDFKSYADLPKNINLQETPYVVIQYESLHRLMQYWNIGDKKLILVCDEINSIIRQMGSTAGVPGYDFLMFGALLKASTHNMFADAFTNINTAETVRLLLKEAGKPVSAHMNIRESVYNHDFTRHHPNFSNRCSPTLVIIFCESVYNHDSTRHHPIGNYVRTHYLYIHTEVNAVRVMTSGIVIVNKFTS